MQKTERYNLNLIESTDTFSPAPLNENMERVEWAITAETAALAQADAALDQRLTALELKKVVFGSYTVGNKALTINVGFTPSAVLLTCNNANVNYTLLLLPGTETYYASDGAKTEIIPNGFHVPRSSTFANCKFNYAAFA